MIGMPKEKVRRRKTITSFRISTGSRTAGLPRLTMNLLSVSCRRRERGGRFNTAVVLLILLVCLSLSLVFGTRPQPHQLLVAAAFQGTAVPVLRSLQHHRHHHASLLRQTRLFSAAESRDNNGSQDNNNKKRRTIKKPARFTQTL